MNDAFAETLQRYLGSILHDHISVRTRSAPAHLPSFLTHCYRFYETRIFGVSCIFVATTDDAATPSEIAKHLRIISSSVDGLVAFAAPSLSATNRSRLIAQRVPFVVVDNQLYLPELAMDLREHFRTAKVQNANAALLPAAQSVLFDHLLHPWEGAASPSSLAPQLHYSAMSIGRAFDDLIAHGLADSEQHGRERHLHFKAEGRALFDAAQTLLRSPVRTAKHIQGSPHELGLKRSGDTALAMLSDLAPTALETFAVAASSWKAIARAHSLTMVSPIDADFTVETWSYDPAALSDSDVVDPLSLYVQFRDHPDERVAMAAERLLERIPWTS